ncbi:MAG TPA: response regulator [Ferrovibrio sp.]|uniref:response regulator n=1 Tax=Ferrovibrio sp. TaxID=1917215 RepID=UPI002B4B32E6|nr:response regulator [Ferrovibrio sp.]HLT77116.1 response regulator [Ferrovibrio sp.]
MIDRPGSDAASHAGRKVSAAPAAEALSIFIAEDDAAVAEVLTDFVSDIGHRVAAVETSHAAALAAAEQIAADIAILDINLQGRPGFAVADRLTARGIPVIFVTGLGILELSGKYEDAVLLKKPFKAEELAEAISRVRVEKLAAAAVTSGAWRESRRRERRSN